MFSATHQMAVRVRRLERVTGELSDKF